jgi:hypothetical protein
MIPQETMHRTLKLLLPLTCLVLVGVQLRQSVPRFSYPTQSDQDAYLEWGRQAATAGRLQSRSPLYSLWIAGAHLAGDGSLTTTFRIERLSTLLLLSAVTGLVAAQVAGFSGGFLAVAWLLDTHYLLKEPNGSHTAAAVLWMAGIACLLVVEGERRRAVGALFFLLSTQIRSDMWLPFALLLVLLSRRDWREGRGQRLRAWALSMGVGLVLVTGLALSSHGFEGNRLRELFGQSLSMTRLERIEGTPPDQLPWDDWEAVWTRTFPGIPDALTLLRDRPGEVVAHFGFQARRSVRTIAADVLRLENPVGLMLAVALWLAVLRSGENTIGPGSRPAALDKPGALGDGLGAAVALLTLIPVSCVFRVAARNYLQLVPPTIVTAIALTKYAVDRGLWKDTRASRTECPPGRFS